MKSPKKKELPSQRGRRSLLQARIDKALKIIDALVYYDSSVSEGDKAELIQVIDILKGMDNDE
jgi:hypothetical protein